MMLLLPRNFALKLKFYPDLFFYSGWILRIFRKSSSPILDSLVLIIFMQQNIIYLFLYPSFSYGFSNHD